MLVPSSKKNENNDSSGVENNNAPPGRAYRHDENVWVGTSIFVGGLDM
jgi:hypothetical protein